MKIKAAVLEEIGRASPFAETTPITICEVDLEGPRDGEVLVEIVAAGLCHSDLSVINGDRPRQLPMVLGHESAGIVRAVGLYIENRMTDHADYNFVMGVASGMPADPDLLPLLIRYKKDRMPWQATVIGREDVWPVHRRAAELGGNLRTGLEDCFYLPDGEKASSNGDMIEALATVARDAGRDVTSADETRAILKLS